MEPDVASQNFAIEPCQFRQLYYIQSKGNPLLAEKVYTLAEPVLTEVQPVNDINSSLKTFYENSVTLVGQVNPPQPTVHLEDPKVYINISQRPSVQDYLVNTTLQQNLVQCENGASNQQTVSVCPINTATSTGTPTIALPKEVSRSKRKQCIKQRQNILSNHTSVHLLKVGSKYHSLSQLTEEQTRLVSQAIQNIGDPEKGPITPTYDSATNTKITYKLVSPKDLKLVGNNKIVIVQNSSTKNQSKNTPIKDKKNKQETNVKIEEPIDEKQIKMTRRGRQVKIPKNIQNEYILLDNSNHKKINCAHCSKEFTTIYKLQQHYDMNPTHVPNNSHTNLFNCLLSIVNKERPGDKTKKCLQELEQFVMKLKSVLPCLLKKVEGCESMFCQINENVSRLFGMSPGSYNVNIDALNCVKENDGTCKHSNSIPKPIYTLNSDLNKPSQIWLSKHIEETATENEAEICARTKSVEKWSPFVRRVWNYKQTNETTNSKKRQLTETEEINLADDNIKGNDDDHTTNVLNVSISPKIEEKGSCAGKINSIEAKIPHIQFRSTHFDIRSSPIKNQSTEFNHFRINLSKLSSKYEGQLLRPSTFTENVDRSSTENTLDGMLEELNTKTDISSNTLDMAHAVNREDCFNRSKDWIGPNVDSDQSHESYQASACIEPTMIHIRDSCENAVDMNTHSTIEEALNVNSCLPLPHPSLNECLRSLNDSELRTNSIELPLDIFSFNNP